MRTYLVNFATPEFFRSRRSLNKTAIGHGIDEVISYTRENILGSEFYKENRAILDQKRGAGYWLWKPYVILEALNKVDPGDIVMYSDAGTDVIGSLEPLFKICEREGILLFQVHGNKNKYWTKRDCFISMGCDDARYFDSEQVQGGLQLYLCNTRSKKFVTEWLGYCRRDNLITDCPNILGEDNFPGFLEHRHDQSILSLLAAKWNLNIYRDPSQSGTPLIHDSKFAESNYPALFDVHRTWDPLLLRLISDFHHIFYIRKDFTLYQKIALLSQVVLHRIRRELAGLP